MKNLDGKRLRFMAIDRKYRSTAYQAVAPINTKKNIYITGQHYDPDDSDRKTFLSQDEILGITKIAPPGRAKKFQPLIQDDTTVFIIHNKEYDCTLNEKGEPNNPKDYWDAHFIVSQNYVADSKSKITPKHIFHIEDKEIEAKIFNTNSDAAYEAEKLIRESASLDDYKDLIKLLNLSVKDFQVDHRPLSSERIKEILIKQAKNDPESIKFAFTQRGKDYIFLAKIIEHKIISKRKDGYYDGEEWKAADAERMVDYISEDINDQSVSKWGRLLKESEAEELV